MTTRITPSHLNIIIEKINTLTNHDICLITNGKTNMGHYHLDYAYSGVELHQIMNEKGGIKVISEGGYITKSKLYEQLVMFQKGIELSKGI